MQGNAILAPITRVQELPHPVRRAYLVGVHRVAAWWNWSLVWHGGIGYTRYARSSWHRVKDVTVSVVVRKDAVLEDEGVEPERVDRAQWGPRKVPVGVRPRTQSNRITF